MRNTILTLKVGEVQIEGVSDIRQQVVNHFIEIFREPNVDRPRLDGVVFHSLSDNDNLSLSAPFSFHELDVSVSQCEGDKSPGLDDFNFSFLKILQNFLRGDLGIMFDQFHQLLSLPHSFSYYFMTLIPKVNSPSLLGDFQPISQVGSLYKLVAKVLAIRLGYLMENLISPNQSVFLKGRMLVDRVVAINEMVDLAKGSKKLSYS